MKKFFLLSFLICLFCSCSNSIPSEQVPIDCLAKAISNDDVSYIVQAYSPQYHDYFSQKLSSSKLHSQYKKLFDLLGGDFSTSFTITSISTSDYLKTNDEIYFVEVDFTFHGKYHSLTNTKSYHLIKIEDNYYLNNLQDANSDLHILFNNQT